MEDDDLGEETVYCGECSNEIEGEYFIGPQGTPWCPNCAKKAAGKCGICKESLLGAEEVLHVGNDAYHKACFKCSMCGMNILGEFKRKRNAVADKKKRKEMKDNEFLCMECCPLFEEFEVQDFKQKQTGRGPSLADLGSGTERECCECHVMFMGEYKKKKDLIKDKKARKKMSDDQYVCPDCAPMLEATMMW
ncbi:unnamed protein product [Amoebophrya sp. A25]|nr:unnamed protein product [Amoebophrya sp. A25]|eukprot:GSA25T00000211001.1